MPAEERDNQRMAESTALVALALIALELDTTIGALCRRFGTSVVQDQSGCRAVPRDLARDHIASVHAARRAAIEASRKAAAEAAAKPHQLREHVRAVRARQELLDAPVDGDGAAVARMLEASGQRDRKLDAAAAMRAELLGGELQYHPVSHRED